MKPLLCCLIFLLPFLSIGQSDQDKTKVIFQQLNAKVDYFIAQNEIDSLQKYCLKRIDFYQSIDKLAAYIYGHCYDLYYDVCDTSPECIIPFLEQAEKMIWRSPVSKEDSVALMILYRDLGFHLMNLGRNVPKAKNILEQAKAILDQGQFEDQVSNNIISKSLGNAYTILGDNERAIRHFSAAVENPLFDNQHQAGNYLNLAIGHWNKNEIIASNQVIKKGLALAGINNKQKGSFYAQLATNYLELQQYDQALVFGQQAFSFYQQEEETPHLHYVLSRIYLGKNDLIQADKNIQKALQLGGKQSGRNTGKYYVTYSEILHRQQQWEAALAMTNAALTAVIPVFSPTDALALPSKDLVYSENTILEALEAKAAILQSWYQQQGGLPKLEAALTCYAMAGEVEQLLRQNYLYESSKLDLLKDSRRRAEAAITLAVELMEEQKESSQIEAAFQFAENSKSIVLLDAIRRNTFLSKLLGKDSLVQRERELLRQKRFFRQLPQKESSAEQVIASREVERSLKQVQSQLLDRYPSYRIGLRQEPVNPTAMIDEETALLEFFYGEKMIYLFLWEKTGGQLIKVQERLMLDSLIPDFLSFFSSKNAIENAPKDYQKKAYQLYQLLFPPLAREIIAGKKELIIIPDGPLSFIPFEALVVTEKESFNLGKVDYLIKSQAVRYAYSTTILEQQQQRHSQNKNLLAMAPVFANSERGQMPLRYSEQELAFFEAPFIKEQATLNNFYQNVRHSQLIHLSTHAKVDELGQPRIEFIDSTLFLDELYTLRLDADLVILSACETGIGTLQKGEGLMSLGRGFAYAGAASLIASLWSAQDASTAWILDEFYQNIQAGQRKSEALYSAKLHYLEQTEFNKSPYAWAVLSFIGADQNLEMKRKRLAWWWWGVGGLCLWLVKRLVFPQKKQII